MKQREIANILPGMVRMGRNTLMNIILLNCMQGVRTTETNYCGCVHVIMSMETLEHGYFIKEYK